ncbi:MAG: hypothetical protein R3C61_04875 [Bacteroidia bacterium]
MNGCSSDVMTLDTLSTVTVHVNPLPVANAGADTALLWATRFSCRVLLGCRAELPVLLDTGDAGYDLEPQFADSDDPAAADHDLHPGGGVQRLCECGGSGGSDCGYQTDGGCGGE